MRQTFSTLHPGWQTWHDSVTTVDPEPILTLGRIMFILIPFEPNNKLEGLGEKEVRGFLSKKG